MNGGEWNGGIPSPPAGDASSKWLSVVRVPLGGQLFSRNGNEKILRLPSRELAEQYRLCLLIGWNFSIKTKPKRFLNLVPMSDEWYADSLLS